MKRVSLEDNRVESTHPARVYILFSDISVFILVYVCLAISVAHKTAFLLVGVASV